jgi:GR25 family glycosyltransferase involved in LPS biosynthesis|tara:strand:+ start:688 stop:1362 length:675 start_codon:yes stop_codon:yes gene_type:complete
MKAYVITIFGNKYSEECADRCIESAAKFGITVEKHKATTPKDNPREIFQRKGIPTNTPPHGFENNKFSRTEPTMSCFLSHLSLWEKIDKEKETALILEHDAVFVNNVDLDSLKFNCLLSLGKPSFGWTHMHRKTGDGVQPLWSKKYIPGAHAYIVKPKAAASLIGLLGTHARPTDVYLSKNNFHWIEEYYPWPVEVIDNMSTLQTVEGAKGKHSYNENFKIIEP